jgi:tetratricopeptide (TPR) repeat protein
VRIVADARRPDDAEQEFRRAIDIHETALDKLHVEPFDEGWDLSYVDLARFLESKGASQAAEEVVRRFSSRIEALRSAYPKNAAHRAWLARVHYELANSLREAGRMADAESHYRQALVQYDSLIAASGTKPEYEAEPRLRLAKIEFDLAELLQAESRLDEAGKHYRLAEAAWRKALELNPKNAEAQNNLAEALARLGSWDEALVTIDKAVELEPADHWYVFRAAPLHLRAGDVAGYRRDCRAMLERFQGTESLEIADRTAKTCLLAPDAVPDFNRVQKLADRVVTGTETRGNYRWFVFVKGLAEYRAGRHAEAVKWLERFGPSADGAQIDASAFAVLAMAQHRLGHQEKGRAALHSAQVLVTQKMPDPSVGRPFDGMWADWLHSQILLREAEALLGQNGKKPLPSPPSTNAATKAGRP